VEHADARKKIPIWGGLYFTKSQPASPLMYREWGESFVTDWKMGRQGVGTGMGMGNNVIHRSILELLYKDSEEVTSGAGTRCAGFRDAEDGGLDPRRACGARPAHGDIFFYDRIIKGN